MFIFAHAFYNPLMETGAAIKGYHANGYWHCNGMVFSNFNVLVIGFTVCLLA
jgi:hypothetical protein